MLRLVRGSERGRWYSRFAAMLWMRLAAEVPDSIGRALAAGGHHAKADDVVSAVSLFSLNVREPWSNHHRTVAPVGLEPTRALLLNGF